MYQFLFRVVREHGGLVIADEVQCGMGRAGENMWGFQDFGLVPDIVTVGKGLGNGFPMGAVMCSKEVSDRLGGYFSTFGGNPVACAIGKRLNSYTEGMFQLQFVLKGSPFLKSLRMKNLSALRTG